MTHDYNVTDLLRIELQGREPYLLEIDDVAVAQSTRKHGVLVRAGRSFFATEPPSSHLRLSFGCAANHDELRESVRRLGSALLDA